ncbi:MAG TPA: histidine kinase [Thermoanaerobaculia bacterium]
MPQTNVAVLAHLVGFLIGAALYAMLFGLAARRRIPTGDGADPGDDRLPLLTAILGLIWNLTGLAAYGIRDFAGRDPDPMLIATAYSALGFLPAVVVHTVLRSQSREQTRGAARVFIVVAYSVSTIAETILFWSARHGVAPAPSALQMLTWSYALLTVPILLLTAQRRGSARGWSILALALFAISALHLSHHVASEESWVEVVGHHASIPLIFAILYQDFRFALADLFLKRAISLFVLVTLASTLYFGIEVPVLSQHDFRSDPVAAGLSVIIWVLLALSYPLLQRVSGKIVDRVVLRRPDYTQLRARILERLGTVDRDADVRDVLRDELQSLLPTIDADPAELTIEIPTAEAPRYSISVGPLAGGRVLLSDDITLLRDVALMAARRIDALRLSRERYDQSLREQEIGKLATEAELRALRAQINPHFLFNALNTIGFLIQTAPPRAQVTLMKLTALLRGVLRTGTSAATLGQEIDLVAAYLEIERARFEERLNVTFDVADELRALSVPPLVLQPLVENAIKHGIAMSRAGGRIEISASRSDDELMLRVRNTGAATTDLAIASGRRHGVGLMNLDARLRSYLGGTARLTLHASPTDTIAEVALPV